jgi:pimeloyl-ACP methyl ester carboxylesterase
MRRVLALAALVSTLAGCPAFHRGVLPGAPPNADYLEVDGVRVRYLDVGHGPPVVLIHGYASSLDAWARVIPVLVRDHHRVLALDLKGFGWSGRPPGRYSPEAEARLVLHLMDARGIGRADVVAHSWGGSVALALALKAPKRVRRLALYDAWVYDDEIPSFFRWARARPLGEILFSLFYKQRPADRLALAYYDPTRIPQSLVDAVRRALDRPGTVAAALAVVRSLDFVHLERRYHSVRQPTLLLWGREDLVSPLATGERLSADLPDARLVVFPRCGHMPMVEAAARSTRALVRFLDAPGATP